MQSQNSIDGNPEGTQTLGLESIKANSLKYAAVRKNPLVSAGDARDKSSIHASGRSPAVGNGKEV